MEAENKKYGFSCELKPAHHFKGLKREFSIDRVCFSIQDNIFTIDYDKEELEEKAKTLALSEIKYWEFEHNLKLVYDLGNHKWEPDKDKRKCILKLKLEEKIEIHDRIIAFDNTKGLSCRKIIYDSNDFGKDLNRTKIITENEALQKVFKIYEEEVLGNREYKEKAFYGLYKIIEAFFPNSKELGTLSKQLNIGRKKIKDLKESCQPQRHAKPQGDPQIIYPVEKAIEITKKIIEKYIKHLIENKFKNGKEVC